MRFRILIAGLLALFVGAVLQAQTLSGPDLVKALRHGGYVIVMRHATTDRDKPDVRSANPDNINQERQLDELGAQNTAEFGKALRHLKIRIGEVLASPAYRALETARLAGLNSPTPQPELGENGGDMRKASEAQAAWLRQAVTRFPSGTNTIMITHQPNITAAFPNLMPPPREGEAIIFGPDGKGGATVVARVAIDEWPMMKS